MSRRSRSLEEIRVRKSIMTARADLHRSTLKYVAVPLKKMLTSAEIAFVTARTVREILRQFRKE